MAIKGFTPTPPTIDFSGDDTPIFRAAKIAKLMGIEGLDRGQLIEVLTFYQDCDRVKGRRDGRG